MPILWLRNDAYIMVADTKDTPLILRMFTKPNLLHQ